MVGWGFGMVWTRWSSIFPKHPFCQVAVILLILFCKLSWWKIASAASNWNNSDPQTEATTFAFSSVFILLLCSTSSQGATQRDCGLEPRTSAFHQQTGGLSLMLDRHHICSLFTLTGPRKCWRLVLNPWLFSEFCLQFSNVTFFSTLLVAAIRVYCISGSCLCWTLYTFLYSVYISLTSISRLCF